MNIDLHLIRESHDLGPASAVLLPGSNPEKWLPALAHLGIEEHQNLYALPQSSTDPQCNGLFVPLPETIEKRTLPTGTGGKTTFPPGSFRYRRHHHLYLPTDASLQPALLQEEHDALFGASPENLWLFHPALGLICFEARDAITPSQLIAAPSLKTNSTGYWKHANPGIQFARTLQQLTPIVPPPHRTPPNPFKDTPKDDEEKKDNDPQLDLNPDSSRFDKELNRLLKMLKADPDKGLRHAIPMAGTDRSRGRKRAKPKLTDNGPVRFVLNNLFGRGRSGPGAAWHASYDVISRINQAYHEAAQREMELGRYARAAYIYGELLDDPMSAANALVQGQRYRDAAEIYKRLKKSKLAAECLENGGYLEEAAELYEAQNNHLKAGRLHRRLGNEEKARAHFETEIENLLAKRSVFTATDVMVKDLHDPARAITELERHPTNAPFMKKCFGLLGETGDHERAQNLIDTLRSTDKAPINTLAHVAQHYPDRATQSDARRTGRALISEQINHRNKHELGPLLLILQPGDNILARDLDRFYKIDPTPQTPQTPTRRAPDVETILHVPNTIQPTALTRCKNLHIGYATSGRDKAVFNIFDRSGHHQQEQLTIHNPSLSPLLVANHPQRNILFFAGHQQPSFQTEGGIITKDGNRIFITSPSWLPDAPLAMTMTRDNHFAILAKTSTGTQLLWYNYDGILRHSLPVPGPIHSPQLAAQDNLVWLSTDDAVHAYAPNHQRPIRTIRLPGITHLQANDQFVVAQTGGRSGAAYQISSTRDDPFRIAPRLLCLLPQHALTTNWNTTDIYHLTDDSPPKHLHKLDLPIDVQNQRFAPTQKPNEFIVWGQQEFRRIRFRA